MIKSLIVLSALIGTPLFADGGEVTSEATSIETTSEVVEEEETSEDEIIEIEEDTAEEEDFDFGTWVGETFTWQTVSAILSYIVAISAVARTFNNGKEIAEKAVKALKKSENSTNNVVYSAMAESIKESVVPLVENLVKLQEQTLKATKLNIEMIAASQDTSVSGKKYLAELTAQIGSIFEDSKEFAKTISTDITSAVETAEQAKVEIAEQLDEIVDEVKTTAESLE